MSEQYKIWGKTELPASSLVVAWNRDMSQLGNSISDYLIGKLGGQNFAEIEPVDFFRWRCHGREQLDSVPRKQILPVPNRRRAGLC